MPFVKGIWGVMTLYPVPGVLPGYRLPSQKGHSLKGTPAQSSGMVSHRAPTVRRLAALYSLTHSPNVGSQCRTSRYDHHVAEFKVSHQGPTGTESSCDARWKPQDAAVGVCAAIRRPPGLLRCLKNHSPRFSARCRDLSSDTRGHGASCRTRSGQPEQHLTRIPELSGVWQVGYPVRYRRLVAESGYSRSTVARRLPAVLALLAEVGGLFMTGRWGGCRGRRRTVRIVCTRRAGRIRTGPHMRCGGAGRDGAVMWPPPSIPKVWPLGQVFAL